MPKANLSWLLLVKWRVSKINRGWPGRLVHRWTLIIILTIHWIIDMVESLECPQLCNTNNAMPCRVLDRRKLAVWSLSMLIANVKVQVVEARDDRLIFKFTKKPGKT